MGVIRWEENVDGKWRGFLGKLEVVLIYRDSYSSDDSPEFFVVQHDACPTVYARARFPRDNPLVSSIEEGKQLAQADVQEWLDATGLMSKAGAA